MRTGQDAVEWKSDYATRKNPSRALLESEEHSERMITTTQSKVKTRVIK